MNTLSTVQQLKDNEQDFEWYPTTQEIIDSINKDLEVQKYNRGRYNTILDCGAGDGRVLEALDIPTKYAIEKSQILIKKQSKNIFIIGTDFHQQTLLDKKIDVTFCNPPYSEYEEWTTKIISQSLSSLIYLVIPSRWVNNSGIMETLAKSGSNYEVIHTTDFLSADRKARAYVDVVRISSYKRTDEVFSKWFDDTFDIKDSKTKTLSEKIEEETTSISKDGNRKSVTTGQTLIHILVSLYNKDLEYLLSNLKAICKLDAALLDVMGVSVSGLKGSLKLKIEEIKHKYWGELFNRFTPITQRLTVKNREALLSKLLDNTRVDFTIENAQAIVLWVVKNANDYLETQLTDTFKLLVKEANVIKYKSNERTFKNEKWRYSDIENIGEFYLDYRIVLENNGGVATNFMGKREIHPRTLSLLRDILVVAHNLGYNTSDTVNPATIKWVAGKAESFNTLCYRTGKEMELMSVKAFLNGNVHIKFDASFMLRWSVEFGRLMGWIKSAQQAADEFQKYTKDEIQEHLQGNFSITESNGANLLQQL